MANPRDTVSFVGIDPVYVTFKIDNSTIIYSATANNGSSQIGLAVTFSADDTVALTADGDAVAGKLIMVSADNKCTVQIEGGMTLPGGASATLTRGSAIVGALGAASAKGYIRTAASATAAELIKARGMIFNNADTANVTVFLS